MAQEVYPRYPRQVDELQKSWYLVLEANPLEVELVPKSAPLKQSLLRLSTCELKGEEATSVGKRFVRKGEWPWKSREEQG